MRIAIVVHGRFHAFDLAKALIKRGNEVTIYTNYPVWAVRKFGIPENVVRGFWLHGVLYRIIYKFSNSGLRWDTSGFLNSMFGRWVAAQIRKAGDPVDVVHCFSGIAAELLKDAPKPPRKTVYLTVRGSSHIAVQDNLLREEEIRSKRRVERPSQTIIEREEAEYLLADRIVTLSSFAYNSFLSEGVGREKLALVPLGVNVKDFQASQEVIEGRCERIRKGDPLRVLWVGTMSLRKGLLDYIEIVKALAGPRFQFRFVGDVPSDLRPLVASISDSVELIPRQRQWNLRHQYAWGDVFVFPTIEDGFAVVLAQAIACGLPVLTTTNCAGPDIVRENETGWVLPIRSPQAFVDRLRWCDQNRDALARIVTNTGHESIHRTWDDMAQDFENLCRQTLSALGSEATSPGETRRRTTVSEI